MLAEVIDQQTLSSLRSPRSEVGPVGADLLRLIRQERRANRFGDRSFSSTELVQQGINTLTAQLRNGDTEILGRLLDECCKSNNPKGAAAALVNRLFPIEKSDPRVNSSSYPGAIGFYHTLPFLTFQISNALSLTNADTFVDIGGGNGVTAALIALLNPQADVVSLEIQEELCRQAQRIKDTFNISNLRILHGDVLTADLSQATAMYLFYPFEDEMSSRFLEKFNPERLPDLLLNGNSEEVLQSKFPMLQKRCCQLGSNDLSLWIGNVRSRDS